MPIYEYICADCGHAFEDFVQSSSDRKTPACPKCDSHKAARQFSLFAAREGQQASSGGAMPGGCGRCGDPNGPCTN